MAQRISNKDLEAVAQRINRITNSPLTYSDKQPDGRFKSNIGHFHISYAYGGTCLQRVVNEGGGVSCPVGNYHRPKRELYDAMQAFINGLELGR